MLLVRGEQNDDVRVGLGDDVAALGRDHDALAEGASCRIVYGLEETSRDTRSTFYAWAVVKFTVVVRRTVLDPMHFRARPMRDFYGGRSNDTYLFVHNGSKHS